jgi:hypothetical protein
MFFSITCCVSEDLHTVRAEREQVCKRLHLGVHVVRPIFLQPVPLAGRCCAGVLVLPARCAVMCRVPACTYMDCACCSVRALANASMSDRLRVTRVLSSVTPSHLNRAVDQESLRMGDSSGLSHVLTCDQTTCSAY